MNISMLPALLAWAALGASLSWLYYAVLAWHVRLLIAPQPGGLAHLATLMRLLVIGVVLCEAARHGAATLLSTATALHLGRAMLLHAGKREAAP